MSQNDSVPHGAAARQVPAEYKAILDKMSGALRRGLDTATGHSPEQQEMYNAFSTMLKDLRYPIGPPDEEGRSDVMNADFFAPFVAYHLVRCGWRPNSDKRKIKSRKVPGRGMVIDAVEWVDINAPDDPLRHLDTMSMQEVSMLPEVWKYEAIRRLGGQVKSDLPEPNSWKVNTKINISDMPSDPNELFK